MVDDDRLDLDVAEVAHRLGVSPATVYRLHHDGKLTSYRLRGGPHRFSAVEVERLRRASTDTR